MISTESLFTITSKLPLALVGTLVWPGAREESGKEGKPGQLLRARVRAM